MSLNRTAKTVITLLIATLAIITASAAFAADGAPVIQAGSQSLNENEILQVLGSSAGGNPMMVGMMLAQATSKDRLEMANQISDALVFAEHAFVLENAPGGRTRLLQVETCRGALVPLLWPWLRFYARPSFERMNRALKRRCEGGRP